MLQTLDHVIIAVADVEAAEASYATLLGRQASWAGSHPQYGTRNVLFRLENTYVELLAAEGDGAFADLLRQKIATEGEGPIGLVFGTSDAEAAHARLAAAGLEPAAPAAGSGVDARTGAERRWRNVFLPQERTGGLFMFVIAHESPADALPLTEPAGPAAAAVNALDHVVVQTQDPEAAIQLFGEPGLGLRLALDRTVEEWGGRMLFFRLGGATLEVVGKLGGVDATSAAAEGPTHRFWGIAYKVADIDAAQARLAGAGVEISEVREGRKPGTRVATAKSHTHGAPTLLIGPA